MAATTRSATSRKKSVAPEQTISARKAPSIARRNRSASSATASSPRKKTALDLHKEHKSIEQATADFALAEIIGLSAFTESIGTLSNTFSQINNIVSKNSGRALRNNRQSYHQFWASDQRNMHDFMSVSADCVINSYDTFADIVKDIGSVIRKARTRITEPYSSRITLYQDLIQDGTDLKENTSGQ